MKRQGPDREETDVRDQAFGAWLGERVRDGTSGDEPAPRDAIWQGVATRVAPLLQRWRRHHVGRRVVRRLVPLLAAAAIVVAVLARYGPWMGPDQPAPADAAGEFAARVETMERQIEELERRAPATVAALQPHARRSVEVLGEAIRVTRPRAMDSADGEFATRHLVRLLAMKRRILEDALSDRWSGGGL